MHSREPCHGSLRLSRFSGPCVCEKKVLRPPSLPGNSREVVPDWAPEAKKALWAKTSKHSSGDCRCCWSIYGRTTGRAHQRVDPRLLDSVHCMKSPGPRSMSTHAKMSSTVTAAAKAGT